MGNRLSGICSKAHPQALFPSWEMPVIFIIAEIVVIECFQQDKSSGILVSESLEAFIGSFFKIPEADDVAVVFYGIQYAVGSGVC